MSVPSVPSPVPSPVQLSTDDVEEDEPCTVSFVGLIGCLALVAVTDDEMYAWHIAGMDLANVLNPEMRQMSLRHFRVEVEASDARVAWFKEWIGERLKNGKKVAVWMAGPYAEPGVVSFFGVPQQNVMRTEKGPVTVTWSPALGWGESEPVYDA